MLLKHKKVEGEYKFIRTYRKGSCKYCWYYHANRKDSRTICILPGYEKINKICREGRNFFIYYRQ